MKQLLKTVEDKGITRVKFFITDINGHSKFMIIPCSYLEEAVTGIGIDGSSIPGFTTVDNSDLIAKPDLESVVFHENEVAIFCDVEYEDGRPFEGDPRGILKKILKKGTFYVKPELEFFFFKDKTPIDSKGYMDTGVGLTIIGEVISDLDIEVERFHHENGPGQYEIELVLAPALKACDNVILLKDVLKRRAKERQLTCTFMPKPLRNKAGNGMHFHILLEENGENLFEGFTETALHFVGGLLAHAKGITAISNPTINSYKRLVHNFEAPVHISWGRGNRSTLVRIPQGGKTRIEYRSPDPSCNPYLALAVILGAGFEGIKRKIKPPEETIENVFELENGELLPATLEEAIERLKEDSLIREILGEHVVKGFIELKEKEIESYREYVSQWEIDHYLDI